MPFISSVRGSFGAQGRFGKSIPPITLETLNWSTSGSGVTVTETSTKTYRTFNTSGANTGWNKGANTQSFKGPFTLKLRKNGESTDQGNAYGMFGILPSSNLEGHRNALANSTENYGWGYVHYPVSTSSNSAWYEVGTNGPLGSWSSGDTFYITVDLNNTLKYWNGSVSNRSVSVTANTDWHVYYAAYSANNTFGGFYDIQLYKNGVWNGSSVVSPY